MDSFFIRGTLLCGCQNTALVLLRWVEDTVMTEYFWEKIGALFFSNSSENIVHICYSNEKTENLPKCFQILWKLSYQCCFTNSCSRYDLNTKTQDRALSTPNVEIEPSVDLTCMLLTVGGDLKKNLSHARRKVKCTVCWQAQMCCKQLNAQQRVKHT